MTNESRVAAGISTGGQFATQNRTESDATLDAATDEKIFTVFGYWDGDDLVVDFTVEGDEGDERDEYVDGYQSFCAMGMGLTAEAAEREVLQEYDPQPERDLNPIFNQLRADPNRHDPAVLDKYVRELDQYIERPETMLDDEGFLRTDLGPRVSLSASNASEIGKARDVLKRLARVRDVQ